MDSQVAPQTGSPGTRDGTATPSARLKRKIELVSGPFARACSRVFGDGDLRRVLPAHFISTHAVIRATVPLMEAGAGRARDLGDDDPVAAGVAEYLARHAEEERDHDTWLLDDLALMGVDRRAVLRRVPTPTEASLVGSQYYWTFHYHPLAQLGYIAFMEGHPPSSELVDRLVEESGFPREAFRTFLAHGELDPHHRDELDEAIDSLPLTAEHEALLGLSAMSTAELRARSIEEAVDQA